MRTENTFESMVEDIKSHITPDEYKDVCYGGCSSGAASGFIYTSEINAFFDKHEDAIEDFIHELYIDMGYASLPEFLLSLNTNAIGTLNDISAIKAAMVWVTVEELVRQFQDEIENMEKCQNCEKPFEDADSIFCSKECEEQWEKLSKEIAK